MKWPLASPYSNVRYGRDSLHYRVGGQALALSSGKSSDYHYCRSYHWKCQLIITIITVIIIMIVITIIINSVRYGRDSLHHRVGSQALALSSGKSSDYHYCRSYHWKCQLIITIIAVIIIIIVITIVINDVRYGRDSLHHRVGGQALAVLRERWDMRIVTYLLSLLLLLSLFL